MKSITLISAVVGTLVAVTGTVQANDLTGRQIVEKVIARDDGQTVERDIKLEKISRSGTVRVENSRSYRKYFGKDKRSVFFYTSPAKVKGTGFLTFDYADVKQNDDQWLYLPKFRKVRRISSSDRGDYFLGTDLTYEEIKQEQKLEISDFNYRYVGKKTIDGRELLVVEATTVNEDIAEDLGYSKVISHVDPAIWMSRKTNFFDLNGNPLKILTVESVETIDGIHTATKLYVKNLKTQHATRLTFSNVRYNKSVDDSLFSKRRLRRGL